MQYKVIFRHNLRQLIKFDMKRLILESYLIKTTSSVQYINISFLLFIMNLQKSKVKLKKKSLYICSGKKMLIVIISDWLFYTTPTTYIDTPRSFISDHPIFEKAAWLKHISQYPKKSIRDVYTCLKVEYIRMSSIREFGISGQKYWCFPTNFIIKSAIVTIGTIKAYPNK